MDGAKAPRTVRNFLNYVREGFYSGTIFHRVIPGQVIQGGGFTAEFEPKPTRPPILNESNNGLKNIRGAVAMARRKDPDSAMAQFYINVKDNPQWDAKPGQLGYAVFGKVVSGMEVVDKIGSAETHTVTITDRTTTPPTQHEMLDVPVQPILIHSIRIQPQ